MKKKFISGIILMVLTCSICFNFYKVEAYSGEVDPNNYITLPSTIYIKDGIGTGTITLSSSASGYSIAYQKVDITENQKNNLTQKMDELNSYITSSNTTLKEKLANVQTLQKEYNDLVSSGTATSEQLETAKTAFNNAKSDYENFYNTASERISTLENELNALIPDYTSSWTTTNTGSDNVKLDFKNYSGTVHFILWVKITNGTNTYYDRSFYSSNIKQNATIDDAKDDTNDDTNGDANDGNDWTNFSNANIELKKEGISKAIVQISNIIPKKNRRYYMFITSDNSKPNVSSESSDELLNLEYNEETKTFITTDSSKVAKYVELNQDIYITILEKKLEDGENIVLYGKKVERFAEPKYSDAFHATFMTNDSNQLITTFTHAKENNRKMQIKVGKITDASILQKIKKQDSSGFASLLTFAKSNNGIFNKSLDADKDDNFCIEYNAGKSVSTNNSLINLNGLENDAYYFLYVKVEDENGKYISPEAVTLARASVYKDGWGLFFYGSSDFKWADFGDVDTDETTAKGTIPQTGINTIIGTILGIAIVGTGVFSYTQYKRNNF